MSLKKLGRYDLVRVLGKGAMGLVYEGRDPNLDRRVAIKTIKVENLSDEAAAEYEVRFRTEARSAARLQHPNIVSVYDSDRDGDIAFLVMEFVQGDDLKHHLDKGEVYTLQQTLGIMADLLSALEYAHLQKIVHRDIKPANLLVQASGSIKLADFGVARIQDSGDATRTQGSIVGTLKYMSPEQLEGRPIDARADLFAAGVVLYQLLTSKRPFDGDTDFAVIQKIVSHTPAAATFYNAKLPPAIDAVVAKSLAKSRDMRYSTAQEFATALQDACKEATDTTIAPVSTVPAKGSNTTWTATMMPGESLINTESGVGTAGGTSTGTVSGSSLVTQEVELVYWKDIKESTDAQDIQGFLAKFPSGIYADLARRRLKNMGHTAPQEQVDYSMDKTMIVDKTMANDKTLVMPRQGATDETAAIALAQAVDHAETVETDQAEPGAEPLNLDTQVADAAAQSAPPKSKMTWLLGAAALVVVVGAAIKMWPSSGDAAAPAPITGPQLAASAPEASASAPATALTAASAPVKVASAPAATASAPGSAPGSAPSSAASRPLAASPATSALTAAKPANAASKAAAAVKKALTENDKPAKEEASKPVDHSSSTAPNSVSANNPRAACEDRMLLGFQSCMTEQCNKAAFANHPTCQERKAMDERRREAERNR